MFKPEVPEGEPESRTSDRRTTGSPPYIGPPCLPVQPEAPEAQPEVSRPEEIRHEPPFGCPAARVALAAATYGRGSTARRAESPAQATTYSTNGGLGDRQE
jgi:hypothetical protein